MARLGAISEIKRLLGEALSSQNAFSLHNALSFRALFKAAHSVNDSLVDLALLLWVSDSERFQPLIRLDTEGVSFFAFLE